MPWNTEKPVYPNAIKMPEEPVAQRVARGQAWARQYNPQDPLLPDVMADRVRGGYQKELIDKRDALYHNTNLINQAMYGGFNPDNKMPSTEEELVASSPEVRAAWRRWTITSANHSTTSWRRTPVVRRGGDPAALRTTRICMRCRRASWMRTGRSSLIPTSRALRGCQPALL